MIAATAAPIDGSLVLRSQAGDREAIDELAEWVRPVVQGYASRFFSDSTRGEDVAQIALMKVIARVGDVRSPAAFSAWLLRVVRNECINELSRQRHAQLPLSTLAAEGTQIQAPAGGDDDPEETLLRRELQGLVREVAATLPPQHREVLIMRALEDRSYEEVSAALDVPLSVARLRYFRACERFRSAFLTRLVARRGVSPLCRDTGAAIAAMIEGTLPAADRPRVREHLAGCHVCRQTEDELRNTAFRTPSRALIPGLGLLRIGGRLPGRVRDVVSGAPRMAAQFAVTGAGGVLLATSVTGAPAPAVAPGVVAASSGDVHITGLTARAAEAAVAARDPRLRAGAGTTAASSQPDAGHHPATGSLGPVLQRLDGLAPDARRLAGMIPLSPVAALLAHDPAIAIDMAASTTFTSTLHSEHSWERGSSDRPR